MDRILLDDSIAVSQLSDAFGTPYPVEPSVPARLRLAVEAFPDRLAVASIWQPAGLYGLGNGANHTYLRWTYKELLAGAERLAAGLVEMGARRDTAVATFLNNGVEFVLALWAAHLLGCPFVPLSPKVLINEEEAAHMLRTVGRSIIIAQDAETAERLDSLSLDACLVQSRIAIVREGLKSSWQPFDALVDDTVKPPKRSIADIEYAEDDTVTILFTSGTTSLPKGVPHTSTTLDAFSQNLALGGRTETSAFCCVLPNNHGFGYLSTLHFMMHGAAIVYPSPVFEVNNLVKALEAEDVTHTGLVPTMLHALLDVLKTRGRALESSLVNVCLSGSSVTPDNIRQVVYELGSKAVSAGFGMTEGSPIWSAPKQDPEDLIIGNYTVAGNVSPGARVRICDPDTHEVLPRGKHGEIHHTGPGLVRGYIGGVGKENFYEVDGVRWFKTGDQGLMHPDGRISITGRYKDIINRGGEKIAPAAMEVVLSRFCGVAAQVVATPCPISGEVPVVVLPSWGESSIKAIQDAVLGHMGTAFVPDEVLTLGDLGIEDFPKTVSGKIQKNKLGALIREFRTQRERQSDTVGLNRSIKASLLRAYSKSAGIPVANLDINVPTSSFADSIIHMRARDFLRKDLGFSLTLKEITDYPTIASQVNLLQGRNAQMKQARAIASVGPPTRRDLTLHFGNVEEAESMTRLISETLESKGLDWRQDVLAVMPSTDYVQVLVETGQIDSWNLAIAVMAEGSSLKEARTGLEKALTNNPLLTSVYVIDRHKNPHYVTLKPTAKLFDLCIIDRGTVKTAADVQQIALDLPFTNEHAQAPGPLTTALMVHVEETNSAAIVVYVHHSVQDASYLRLFFGDLEHALAQPLKELPPHVDYKAWVESYVALRHSPAATASVNYHVKRLTGIHQHKHAFYPPAPLPRAAITEHPHGLDYGFDAPGLLGLKKAHPDVGAAAVLRAALAVVNVERTGHTHAFFHNFEAGRERFPFVPESLAALSPDSFEASDVGGPTMQGITNMIEVPREEKAIDFLRRLQAEQKEHTHHAHAPLRRVLDDLNADGSGAGDLCVEVARSQLVSWVPGFIGDYECIQIAQLASRPIAGLVVAGGLGGPAATFYSLTTRWDVNNYSREKTARYLNDLEKVILWLTKTTNWDRPVQDLLAELQTSKATKET